MLGLSSPAQKFLITLNMDLCWELRCAVFFWGHDTSSVVEQVNTNFPRIRSRRQQKFASEIRSNIIVLVIY
jgi:hypothetical protein